MNNKENGIFVNTLLDLLKSDNITNEINKKIIEESKEIAYSNIELKKQNQELYDVQFKLFNIINKNINNLELTDDECIFIDYYMNKLNALYNILGDDK